MAIRRYPLDYYLKGLSPFDQRRVWELVRLEINSRECEFLIDEENGYENVFRSGYYRNHEELGRFLQRQEQLFLAVNEFLKKLGRPPLFKDTKNLNECAKFRNFLISFQPESDCNRIIGCESYASYVPEILDEDCE